jgi:hypothetical protein
MKRLVLLAALQQYRGVIHAALEQLGVEWQGGHQCTDEQQEEADVHGSAGWAFFFLSPPYSSLSGR